MSWTVVYRAQGLMEAENARGMLSSAGFDVQIWDYHFGAMYP